jgi:hypothetical protein
VTPANREPRIVIFTPGGPMKSARIHHGSSPKIHADRDTLPQKILLDSLKNIVGFSELDLVFVRKIRLGRFGRGRAGGGGFGWGGVLGEGRCCRAENGDGGSCQEQYCASADGARC